MKIATELNTKTNTIELQIFVPFVFALLSIAMGDIFGVLIIGYVVALSIFRIK